MPSEARQNTRNRAETAVHDSPTGPGRKTSRQRTYDAKRARGEISCAECRRLKIKCDKNIPCNTCVRRGCANICPSGSLSGGQGTRLILADTESLHRKITQLSERVRQLEDALAIMQAAVSQEKHPLLRGDLLQVKFWPELDERSEDVPSSAGNDQVADVIRELGTLSIGEHGDALYFGQSAGSESLLHSLDSYDHKPQVPELDDLPALIVSLDNYHTDAQQVLQALEGSLPPITRAWSLCETYYEHCAVYYRPVKRDEFVNYFMTPIYNALKEKPQPGTVVARSPHKMAVIYLLFAMGALMDLTQAPYNKEAWRYAVLGKNALLLRTVKDSPAIETVQAMALLAYFFSQSGRRHTIEFTWSIMSNCLRHAQTIGLHRDCARWGLDAKAVQRRRYVFWEIYRSDVQLSLYVGRPPTIAAAFVDCEFPTDEEQTLDSEEKVEPGFWQWQYSMAKNLFAPILEDIASVRPSSYASVLEFDRKARQLVVPSAFSFIPSPDHESYRTPSVWIRACITLHYRLSPLLYIHRPWFTQALVDPSGDPLRSQYAPSYLAVYRCSVLIVKSYMHYFEQFPDVFMRQGSIWTYLFTSGVILGLIVTKGPASSIANSALALLDMAVDVFEKGAVINARAQRAIPFLRNLREEAHRVDSNARPSGPAPNSLLGNGPTAGGPDELAIFGGQTRLLNSKTLTKYWAEGVRLRGLLPERCIDLSYVAATGVDSAPANSQRTVGQFSPQDASLAGPSSDTRHNSAGEASPTAIQDSLTFWNGPSFANEFLEFPQDTSFLAGPSPPTGDTPESGFEAAPRAAEYDSPQYPDPLAFPYSTDVAAMTLVSNMAEPQADYDMDQQWLELMRGAGLLDNTLFHV
ncbi:hypothetical protein OE88DRAFT_1663469 [Heliocybe sulcata]|uniref:Zn(2)-C6 fungal-type domain-containing protein n=1 Tax=Heliocybe sulcata TaxID=5364 RepID=A0A5C3MY53_9AGAM|nr:hypothetical protein OE88DRAFT_1663469 [Heliocybe sulcata]